MKRSALQKIGNAFKSFWEKVGTDFPSLTGAPSTEYYRECEEILLRTFCPEMQGKKVFKTDLWDEAKNTRILKWIADQGASVYGIDISYPIVRDAVRIFHPDRPGAIVSDIRQIGFAAESFDLIYSMGTIEHFPEYKKALEECHRILKKGGRAVIGVPNKFDPFLRPLSVTILHRLGLYSYGDEKSFSRKQLRTILEKTGFRVIDDSGILFIPGILRMAELFLFVRRPGLALLTRPFVRFFAMLYRRFPSLRRHGYLIACLVEKE